MRLWVLKGIILFAVLRCGALHSYSDGEFKNIIIKDIMKKIQKIADSFSNAPADKKPQILSQIEEKLKAAAKQSFGDEGGKYVELIMQGVRIKAFSNTSNDSKENNTVHFKSQINVLETSIDEYQSSERIVKDHMVNQVTDKIEEFAKKYLIKLKSYDQKRKFLENVGQKIIEVAKVKRFNKLKDSDIASYNDIITNSINVILKRNLEHNARKMINNIGDSKEILNQKSSVQEYSQNQNEEILKDNVENFKSEIECVVSIAMVCSDVNSLNKFTCHVEEKTIGVENICNGVVDCSDRSDENNCTNQIAKRLDYAKAFLLELNQSIEQNCFSGKINEPLPHINILRDLVKAQIAVIDDYLDSHQLNNDTESYKETVKNVSNILNIVILNLNKGICSRQEKSRALVANVRRFNRILDEDLEEVLKESALFPKSCVCKEDRCVSNTCVNSCHNACLLKYRLERWSCPSVNGTMSVHLNEICDGKLDCYDESDESECSTGKGRGKFEANEAYLRITKILEIKMASKENAHIRNELLRLYNLVIKLQHLSTSSKPTMKDVKTIRDKCFALLSFIYENYMRTSYNTNEAEEMYRFLYSVNNILGTALKQTNTGNTRIISSYGCVCRKKKCMMPKCSIRCMRACSVENKLSRYYCRDGPQNRSVSVEAICDSKKDCPLADDEFNCNEICRRHHLYFLRHSIQDVGKNREGTTLGELLKFWRAKVTSMLLVAEKYERPTPYALKKVVKDMLQDLVYTYASFDANRRKNADSVMQEFFNISQIVINALRSCGKYLSFIVFSFAVSFTSAMFRWLEDDTFDCVVGIAVDNRPIGVGAFVHDRLVITSANPLANIPKHRIKVFAINGNPDSSREVDVDYITVDKDRQREWIRIGFDRKHSTYHDIMLISVTDDETVFIKHQTLPRRPYYMSLVDKNAEVANNGWQFAGFGFVNKRHVKTNEILKAAKYRDPVMVDCNQYLPRAWGNFICILNVENFAGVQSGAPLIHKNLLYGIGSFSFVKGNKTILVFTDVRPYRGKLIYLYTREWWWG